MTALAMTALLALSACQNSDSSGAGPTTTGATTTEAEVQGFDDHTVAIISSVSEFEELARVEAGRSAVKFAIPDLSEPGVVWFDSSFYELHDEWYWFRLLNGEPVPGLDTAPVAPGTTPGFATIAEVYDWARARPDDLPLDLAFTADGERLYSNEYYDLALRDSDKTYGLGTVVRFPYEEGDRWVIETEYSEATTPESVGQFIDRISEALPAEMAESVVWVVRSPLQVETALLMQDESSPHLSRVVNYSDLVEQGEITVYNPGLTAGRLRLVESEADLNLATSDDLLVMDAAPDWLPPASGILTSSPQTPLAHINLLARNRGIPNASVAGLLDDPAIASAARSRAYAVMSAGTDNQLQITLITADQFQQWRSLLTQDQIGVPEVDLDSTPTIVSLTDLASQISSDADVATIRPTIGGKSSGFLALLGADGVTTPDSPMAITVAPYFRHLGSVESQLSTMLADDDFRKDARARFLLLEGGEEFAETYTSDADVEFAQELSDRHPGGPIREILDADGFMNLFRDVTMDQADLDEVTTALTSNFAALADTQGLRFRSSSSVEDIEGFTGAGLYDSNTGFLDPLLQDDEDDHDETVEKNIKKTWASYWSFEAFEERRLENVDHRSGGMGVLVHPRFDDALEASNGVATYTLLPGSGSGEGGAVTVINVQVDDVSVANPDIESGELPEQIVVRIDGDGGAVIDRVATSTLADGDDVMDDDAVLELVEQLDAVTRLWRDRINADLPERQQIETVTLDFEIKTMKPGWPAMADGSVREPRLVVKQARTLDPGLRGLSTELLELPIPRDLLARASLVSRTECPDGTWGIEVFTDRLLGPDMGYADEPYSLASSFAGGDFPDSDQCETTVLLTTPSRFLMELLDAGEGLELG